MNVYDQFIDPTRVTLSTTANFTSNIQKDLIVVKNTILQIFNIVNNKLVLIHELKLNGQVIGIEALNLGGSTLDQLIVLTKFAKVSVVAWDQDRYTVITNSLHFYELEFQANNISHVEYHQESQLRLDPNGFCSLVFYNDVLGFLPFKQDDEELDFEKKSTNNDYFDSSIIVPVSKLEASITNIIDCSFLHNYRDPTLAILYNKSFTWAADLTQRKDTASFTVLSLDLSTGSSTPILNVENLPYDIWYLKTLPAPLNGSLLLGSNEIIHIDNSGNLRGIAVNSYYQKTSNLELEDQSDLELFLEDAKVEIISSSTILIIDKKGNFHTLKFHINGKIINKVTIEKRLENEKFCSFPLSITKIDQSLFIGSGSSNSPLLKINQIKKEQENSQLKPKVDDDDDLYAADDDDLVSTSNDSDDFTLSKTDELINNGPISTFTLGKVSPDQLIQGLENPNKDDISIIATSGEDEFGKLTTFQPSIKPKIHSALRFNNINKTWNILNKFLITTDYSNFKSEIFLINDNFKIFQSFDFKNNNITVNIDTVWESKRILQVCSTNIYLFDSNFKKLFQIKADFEIINAKILDPCVIITNSKGEIRIFEIDSTGKKLNKIKLPESLSDIILTSGSISLTSILSKNSKRKHDDTQVINENLVFLVTTVNNQILAFEKAHNDKVYQLKNINKLIEISELQEFDKPKNLNPDPFIKEIELVKLGDNNSKEEYLVILTIGGELILYKTFYDSNFTPNFLKVENLNLITGAPNNIYPESTIIERKLTKITLNGHEIIFITGKQPYIIYKSSKSNPKIFKFTSKSAISICPFKSTSSNEDDQFMYIDNSKAARICSIPFSSNLHDFTQSLPITIHKVGQSVTNVVYHETSQLLILSCLEEIPFDAKDEEGEPIVGTEDGALKALSYKSSVKLINPINWALIDEIKLKENEVVNDAKSVNLTISTRSKKKKEFVVLGIGEYRTEDLTVYGSFVILDIISIVPDPNKPDLTFKFKEIFREVIKGAVTTVCEISGRFLVSQGPKVLIRDLQQDNSTVPVAFFDTPTYVSESKSFGNLLMLGDSLKSISFLGFDAEPYRLFLLGKDLQDVNVSSADFLVDNGEVYFLVADDDEQLSVLSYQPDDPKSLSGQKLLKKTTFNNNSLATNLRMVPKYEEFKQVEQLDKISYQNIGSNIDGSLFKVTPISEGTYRRLYILQQQLSDKIGHSLGLNPKSNRFSNNELGFKPIIDFNLIRWFILLNVDKRNQFSAKAGKNTYSEIWKDLVEIENSLKNLSSVSSV